MNYISMFFVIFGLLFTSFVFLEAQDEVPSSPSQQAQFYEPSTCDYISDQINGIDAKMRESIENHQRIMNSREALLDGYFRLGKRNAFGLRQNILAMLKELYENRRKQGCIDSH